MQSRRMHSMLRRASPDGAVLNWRATSPIPPNNRSRSGDSCNPLEAIYRCLLSRIQPSYRMQDFFRNF